MGSLPCKSGDLCPHIHSIHFADAWAYDHAINTAARKDIPLNKVKLGTRPDDEPWEQEDVYD